MPPSAPPRTPRRNGEQRGSSSIHGSSSGRLLEYFLVVSHGGTERLLLSDPSEEQLPYIARSYTGVVVDRFPPASAVPPLQSEIPFPPGLEMFCVPAGVRLSLEPPMPKVHFFATTTDRGIRLYGTCLRFYEKLDPTLVSQLIRDDIARHRILMPTEELLAAGSGGDTDKHAASEAPEAGENKGASINHCYGDSTNINVSSEGNGGGGGFLNRPQRFNLYSASSPPTVYVVKCLALLSEHRFFQHFRTILTELYRLSLSPSSIALEAYVGQFMTQIPVPPLGQVKIRYSIADKVVTFKRPPANAPFAFAPFPIDLLFRTLSLDAIEFVVELLLLERRILLVSSSMSALVQIAETLLMLLYPFFWQSVYIPLLPRALLDFLYAPMSFFIGTTTEFLGNFLSEQPGVFEGGLFVVYVDRNEVQYGCGSSLASHLGRSNDTLGAGKRRRHHRRKGMNRRRTLSQVDSYDLPHKFGPIDPKRFRQTPRLPKRERNKLLTALRPMSQFYRRKVLTKYEAKYLHNLDLAFSFAPSPDDADDLHEESRSAYHARYSLSSIIAQSGDGDGHAAVGEQQNNGATVMTPAANMRRSRGCSSVSTPISTVSGASVPVATPFASVSGQAKASPLVSVEEVEKRELQGKRRVSTLPENRVDRMEHNLRAAFFRVFVSLFRHYRRYLISADSGQSGESPSSPLKQGSDEKNRIDSGISASLSEEKLGRPTDFDVARFMATQSSDSKPFLSRFLLTQMWSSFVQSRVFPDPDDMSVLFFDESIIAKKNRSRFARRNATPFLSDSAHEITRSYRVPTLTASNNVAVRSPSLSVQMSRQGQNDLDDTRGASGKIILCNQGNSFAYDVWPTLDSSKFPESRNMCPIMGVTPARLHRKRVFASAAVVPEEEAAAFGNDTVMMDPVKENLNDGEVQRNRRHSRRYSGIVGLRTSGMHTLSPNDEIVLHKRTASDLGEVAFQHRLDVFSQMVYTIWFEIYCRLLIKRLPLLLTHHKMHRSPVSSLDVRSSKFRLLDDAVLVLRRMRGAGVVPHDDIAACLLHACLAIGCKDDVGVLLAELCDADFVFGRSTEEAFVRCADQYQGPVISAADVEAVRKMLLVEHEVMISPPSKKGNNTHVNHMEGTDDLGNGASSAGTYVHLEPQNPITVATSPAFATSASISSAFVPLTSPVSKHRASGHRILLPREIEAKDVLQRIQGPFDIVSGKTRFEEAWPDLTVSTHEVCEECGMIITDGDVWAGWTLSDSDYTSACEGCGNRFVPRINIARRSVAAGGTASEKKDAAMDCTSSLATEGRDNDVHNSFVGQDGVSFVYLAPHVLRKEIANLIKNKTTSVLVSAAALHDASPPLYWNLCYHLVNHRLPGVADLFVVRQRWDRHVLRNRQIMSEDDENDGADDDDDDDDDDDGVFEV